MLRPMLSLFLLLIPGAREDASAPLLDHARLHEALVTLAAQHPARVTHLEAGRSRGGRAIDVLRIGRAPAHRDPAILVVAGLEGRNAWTSGVALHLARAFADLPEGAGRNLRETTLYVVPRANPDACEARFASVLQEVEGTGAGVDDDRDGASGEDAPADVDGDGVIGWMRYPHPQGEWLLDPGDRRLLRRPGTGERGYWRVTREGRDLDGDGRVAEDPTQDAQVNRNFPAGFEPGAPRAGRYPTDEPETRALCDLVALLDEVQVVLVYGDLDDLDGPNDADSADAERQRWIAARYREAIGNGAQGLHADRAGTFQRWCAEHRGLMTLSSRLWELPRQARVPGEVVSDGVRRLRRADEDAREVHLGWTPFEHPELGRVEVGGWRPYAQDEPPPRTADALAADEARFVSGLAGMLGRVALRRVEGRDLGAGLIEITAELRNDALLPLRSQAQRRLQHPRAVTVRLDLPEGATREAGPERIELDDLAGDGARRQLRWLVRGVGGGRVQLVVESANAGRVIHRVEVNR